VEGCIYNPIGFKLTNQTKTPIFVCPIINILMAVVELKTDLMGEMTPAKITKIKM